MAEVSWVELQGRVAEKLQLLAEGEELPAEAAEKIQAALRWVQGQLDALSIASFTVESGVDYAYADVLAELTAG